MNYERAYKEALERAKTFADRWNCMEVIDSELALKEVKEIFPELKRPDDEKIRKAIISLINDSRNDFSSFDGVALHVMIEWLEKQEKKPGKWTKEDDERLGSCIFCTQSFAVENHIDSANTAWLKSIKKRITKGE